MQDKPSLDDTLALMRELRARCEWDAAQSHDSLRPYLIEEAHELDEALREGDDDRIREELGDLLLQVLFHSVVAEQRGAFDLHDVAAGLIAKMRARHPHLYGDGEKQAWETMKAKTRSTLSEGLPQGLPSLHRAHRLQDRAAGVGFDWPDVTGPAGKVEEELAEVRSELTSGAPVERVESEIGDLLFAVVNLARKAGVHPSIALDRANARFERRFAAMEAFARARGVDLSGMDLTSLDSLWNQAKAGEPKP